MPSGPVTSVERKGRVAVVHVHGDLVTVRVRRAHGELRALAKRREVKEVVLDFSDAGRVDSAGIAAVSLLAKQLARAGKSFAVRALDAQQRATLALIPTQAMSPPAEEAPPGALERLGDKLLGGGTSARSLFGLIAETLRQAGKVVARQRQLPAGALSRQIASMGVDAILIVGLLTFLLGMTMAFQGAVQLQRLGAGVYVADMIGVSMVREIAPLMTAVILTGRTGAAIAAELGTMRVRSEIDALETMGISPVRYLILPRITAITFVGPALSLAGMFIGILGGMVVAGLALDLPVVTFWQRVVEQLSFGDFAHGLVKSLMFAWIIGFAGSHLGMRANGDAGSVGAATTRTVVVSIFFIIIVDAAFATITTMMRHP